MNTTLRKCLDCGKLFAAREGAQQCQACSDEERTIFKRIEDAVVLDKVASVPDLALELGVDSDQVRRVLSDLPHLAKLVENDELCPRCGIRPSMIGKDFCSNCLMELNSELRDMTAIAERNRQLETSRPESRMRSLSVANALREKQRRTGHYRFDPVPPNIKRGST